MDILTELKRLLSFALGVKTEGETVAEVLHNVADQLESKANKVEETEKVEEKKQGKRASK